MKNTKFRTILSSIGLITFLSTAIPLNAAPIRFNQVVQIVNAKPGKANIGSFAQLRLADEPVVAKADDGKAVPSSTPPQDGRVIVTTTSEIVEDEACDCLNPPPVGGGFPKWALLGLAAVPLLFLIPNDDDPTPTPTPTNTPPGTQTPPPTQTPPGETPTPTPPTPTPTPTPPGETPTPTQTPTPPPPTETPTPPMSPTPEPVPEPMTILLFGTGLASVGVAARKRLRKNAKSEEGEPEEK